MKTFGLAELLAPTTPEDFLGQHLFRKPLLVRGSPDKFADLFTWESLNRILSYSRHDGLRVHLDRVGSAAEDLEFTQEVVNVRGERLTRVDVRRLYGHLGEHATLVVDAVNDVDPAVAELSDDIAALLSAPRATTVLFCSFGRIPGFAVHWDNRDVYALQVEGQKQWRVFGPSRVAPLGRGDAWVPDSGEPGPLWWEGTLEKGDLLYVPRGWWHEVTSTDGPALHLNLGFAPVTGVDVLAWLTRRLTAEDLVRRDIPRFGSPQELADHERGLKEAFARELARTTMAEFLAALRADAPTPTRVSLPHGIGGVAPPDAVLVQLANRMASSEVVADACVLVSGGRRTALPVAAAPLVSRLLTGDAVSVAELASTVPEIPADDVRTLVEILVQNGVVHTVPL